MKPLPILRSNSHIGNLIERLFARATIPPNDEIHAISIILKLIKISSIMQKVCFGHAQFNSALAPFLGSSMVEHSAVNRRVVGSNPTRGANMDDIGN